MPRTSLRRSVTAGAAVAAVLAATVLAATPASAVIAAPASLAFSMAGGTSTFTWTATPGADSYLVTWSTQDLTQDPADPTTFEGSVSFAPIGTEAVDTTDTVTTSDVPGGAVLEHFKLWSHDSSDSTWSTTPASLDATTAPAPVYNLLATSAQPCPPALSTDNCVGDATVTDSVHVSWTNPDTFARSSHVVIRGVEVPPNSDAPAINTPTDGIDFGSTTPLDPADTTTAPATQLDTIGLPTDGGHYHLVAFTVDSNGNWTAPDQSGGISEVDVPAAPVSGLSAATDSDGGATISWDAPNDSTSVWLMPANGNTQAAFDPAQAIPVLSSNRSYHFSKGDLTAGAHVVSAWTNEIGGLSVQRTTAQFNVYTAQDLQPDVYTSASHGALDLHIAPPAAANWHQIFVFLKAGHTPSGTANAMPTSSPPSFVCTKGSCPSHKLFSGLTDHLEYVLSVYGTDSFGHLGFVQLNDAPRKSGIVVSGLEVPGSANAQPFGQSLRPVLEPNGSADIFWTGGPGVFFSHRAAPTSAAPHPVWSTGKPVPGTSTATGDDAIRAVAIHSSNTAINGRLVLAFTRYAATGGGVYTMYRKADGTWNAPKLALAGPYAVQDLVVDSKGVADVLVAFNGLVKSGTPNGSYLLRGTPGGTFTSKHILATSSATDSGQLGIDSHDVLHFVYARQHATANAADGFYVSSAPAGTFTWSAPASKPLPGTDHFSNLAAIAVNAAGQVFIAANKRCPTVPPCTTEGSYYTTGSGGSFATLARIPGTVTSDRSWDIAVSSGGIVAVGFARVNFDYDPAVPSPGAYTIAKHPGAAWTAPTRTNAGFTDITPGVAFTSVGVLVSSYAVI